MKAITYIYDESNFEVRLVNEDDKHFVISSHQNCYDALKATHRLRVFLGDFTFGENLVDIKFNPNVRFSYSFKVTVDSAIDLIYKEIV